MGETRTSLVSLGRHTHTVYKATHITMTGFRYHKSETDTNQTTTMRGSTEAISAW